MTSAMLLHIIGKLRTLQLSMRFYRDCYTMRMSEQDSTTFIENDNTVNDWIETLETYNVTGELISLMMAAANVLHKKYKV